MRTEKLIEQLKDTLRDIAKYEERQWLSEYEKTTLLLLMSKKDYLINELNKGEKKKCVKKLKSLIHRHLK